jgi:membrane protein YdbS with pleckstrin-like domain
MRLITPRNAGPASVNKYLLPHEHQVITVRKHPAVLMGPIAIGLGGILVALVLMTTIFAHSRQAIVVLAVICVGLLLYVGFKVWEWTLDYFAVTSERMVEVSGVLTRKVAMMPLVKVTDMSFQRSTTGRILGYGKFILESAGQDQALSIIDHVPYPEQLYLEICALIFPAEKIPCPQCDGQGVLIQRNEDGEETTYLCPLCKGRKTVSGDSLVAENRDVGDD